MMSRMRLINKIEQQLGWFEDFEKELREIMQGKYERSYWYEILREILG